MIYFNFSNKIKEEKYNSIEESQGDPDLFLETARFNIFSHFRS